MTTMAPIRVMMPTGYLRTAVRVHESGQPRHDCCSRLYHRRREEESAVTDETTRTTPDDDDEAEPIAPPVAVEPALEPPAIQTLPPADPPSRGIVGP